MRITIEGSPDELRKILGDALLNGKAEIPSSDLGRLSTVWAKFNGKYREFLLELLRLGEMSFDDINRWLDGYLVTQPGRSGRGVGGFLSTGKKHAAPQGVVPPLEIYRVAPNGPRSYRLHPTWKLFLETHLAGS